MADNARNIHVLLNAVAKEFTEIEGAYKASIKLTTIPDSLRVRVKDFCGNLKSVLDYLAHDVKAKYCQTSTGKGKTYFPILPSSQEYASKMQKWFPGLDRIAPDLYQYIESVQPYHTGNEWLSQFNEINNHNKHRELVEQTRIETEWVQVTMQGGSQVSWNPNGVRFGSGVFIGGIPIDPSTQLPIPSATQRVTRVVWVDLRFAGADVSALWLLRISLDGVTEIARKVRSWL